MLRNEWAIIFAVVIPLTACDRPDTAGVVELVGVEPAFAAQGASNPALIADGRAIFRFGTFGDETFWTDTLRMHEVIRTSVSPNAALAVGLKVDVDALPPAVRAGLLDGTVDLDAPATTVALLGLGAVVGVVGQVDAANSLTHVGITCAMCHSTVDDSFAPGIGSRLDGWPNRSKDAVALVTGGNEGIGRGGDRRRGVPGDDRRQARGRGE